ncbi:hypothetical protein GCM10009727_94460 [Actinomadura napierensis]|uniref:Uncharacterized protein n=2 Tax=Actinomadura napierensis TaxID=267854 RepID=A0ABN3AIC5_9ACTN
MCSIMPFAEARGGFCLAWGGVGLAGQARLRFEILLAQGHEGGVLKAADRNREDKRGWWKAKHRTITEAIIGRVTGSLGAPPAPGPRPLRAE